MAKEKIVGFRVSEELFKRLHEMSLEKNTSVSDVLRDIILDNLDMSYQYSQWEVYAWNLFNVNADQLNYAKRVSKAPQQFFSIISKWSKDTKIRVIPHPNLILVEFVYKEKVYLIQESCVLPKIQAIQSIVDQLVSKIEGEVLDATSSLCDGTTGGDIPATSTKQPNESGTDMPESISSEGYTDMSDLDDL